MAHAQAWPAWSWGWGVCPLSQGDFALGAYAGTPSRLPRPRAHGCDHRCAQASPLMLLVSAEPPPAWVAASGSFGPVAIVDVVSRHEGVPLPVCSFLAPSLDRTAGSRAASVFNVLRRGQTRYPWQPEPMFLCLLVLVGLPLPQWPRSSTPKADPHLPCFRSHQCPLGWPQQERSPQAALTS